MSPTPEASPVPCAKEVSDLIKYCVIFGNTEEPDRLEAVDSKVRKAEVALFAAIHAHAERAQAEERATLERMVYADMKSEKERTASAVSEAVEPYKTLSADLQGIIGDLRREVEAQQRATSIASESASEVSGALSLIESAVTLSPRDWSLDARDAIIYGVAVGWGDALRDIIRRHSWDYRASDAVFNGHAALAPYRSRGGEGENVAMPCTYCGQPATRFHIPDTGVGTCEDCLKSGLAPSGAAKEGE